MELADILFDLDSLDNGRRQEAEDRLRALGTKAVPIIITQLEQWATRMVNTIVFWKAVVLLLLLLVTYFPWLSEQTIAHIPLLFLLLLPLPLVLAALFIRLTPAGREAVRFRQGATYHQLQRALFVLAPTGDPRLLAPLLEGLPARDSPTADQSRALTHILEALSTTKGSLSSPRLSRLFRLLRLEYASEHKALLLALLNTLPNNVSPTSLQALRQMIESPADTPDAEEVHQAACACYESILETSQRETQQNRLLRPIEAPSTDTLLRPIQGTDPVDIGRLLRPVVRDPLPGERGES